MNKIVVKIGSSVLANRDGQLNKDIIINLVEDIASIRKQNIYVILVSSGAVSTGKSVKSLRNLKIDTDNAVKYAKDIVKEQVLAAVGQPKLIAFYTQKFEKYNINCAQILTTRSAFADRQAYLSIRTVTNNLLKAGIVPIFNENDVLSPEELDFSDNDQLACMVASMLGADKLILLTDVRGVYDKSINSSKAKLIPVIEDVDKFLNVVDEASGTGKGGMRSKFLSADLINSLGIDMYIAGGFEKNIISRIVKEEMVGTLFPAKQKKAKPLKSWLATAAASEGKVIVSTFLADVLRRRQTASILFTGIENVLGKFSKDQVVEICDDNGILLGVGLIRYNSDDLKRKIKEYKNMPDTDKAKLKTSDIIAIHYNYFVFKKISRSLN